MGLVRGKKEGLENDTGQVNNKLNGNKINKTGYKRDWERTTIGTRWKLCMGSTNNAETGKKRTSIRFHKALRFVLTLDRWFATVICIVTLPSH